MRTYVIIRKVNPLHRTQVQAKDAWYAWAKVHGANPSLRRRDYVVRRA